MKYLIVIAFVLVSVIAYNSGVSVGRKDCPAYQDRLLDEARLDAEANKRMDEMFRNQPTDRELLCDEFFERALEMERQNWMYDQDDMNEAYEDTYER